MSLAAFYFFLGQFLLPLYFKFTLALLQRLSGTCGVHISIEYIFTTHARTYISYRDCNYNRALDLWLFMSMQIPIQMALVS